MNSQLPDGGASASASVAASTPASSPSMSTPVSVASASQGQQPQIEEPQLPTDEQPQPRQSAQQPAQQPSPRQEPLHLPLQPQQQPSSQAQSQAQAPAPAPAPVQPQAQLQQKPQAQPHPKPRPQAQPQQKPQAQPHRQAQHPHPQPQHQRHPPPFPSTSSQVPHQPAPSQTPHSYSVQYPNAHGQPSNESVNVATFKSPRAGNIGMAGSTPYQTLLQLMKSTDPAIVRHVIRDVHEVALLGSEYHYAFLLNTCFHQASPSTLDTTVQRFGAKLVSSSLKSFLTHVTPELLDSVTDLLLPKLSSDFLDRALDKRLSTIRARSLVNALAKAERLGYDARDAVVEGRNGSEHVIPHSKPNLAQNPTQTRQSSYHPLDMNEPRIVPPANQSYQSILAQNLLYCGICGRPCSGGHALRYHKLKKNCEHLENLDRINRDICAHCGTVFSNASGLVYHTKSQVCGNYSTEDAGAIYPWLRKFYLERDAAASMPANPDYQHMSPSADQMSGHHSTFTSINASPSVFPFPTGHAAAKLSSAYADLSAEDKASLDAAMKKAEDKYSEEMRKVLANNEFTVAERDLELSKLKNRFNTKQSITRKKYGIRLRERRPKHEIEAERNRILSMSTTWPPGTGFNSSQSTQVAGEPASKRPRMSMGSHETYKPVTSDLPRRVTIGEMGGLGNSAATAEHVDPTAPAASSPSTTTLPSHQSTSGPLAHGSATEAAKNPTMTPQHNASQGAVAAQGAATGTGPSGTANDPMDVDDDMDSDGDSDSDSGTGADDA